MSNLVDVVVTSSELFCGDAVVNSSPT